MVGGREQRKEGSTISDFPSLEEAQLFDSLHGCTFLMSQSPPVTASCIVGWRHLNVLQKEACSSAKGLPEGAFTSNL